MKNPRTLQVTTPTERVIVLTCVFDAPRRLVFDALTKPVLLRRWHGGPRGWSLTVCEVDLKVGGKWRYVSRGPDGTNMGLGGVYREIVPPERLVSAQTFTDCSAQVGQGETLVTTVLVQDRARTTLTSTLLFPSQEVRDAVIKSGIERGVAQGYDRLAEYLASIA